MNDINLDLISWCVKHLSWRRWHSGRLSRELLEKSCGLWGRLKVDLKVAKLSLANTHMHTSHTCSRWLCQWNGLVSAAAAVADTRWRSGDVIFVCLLMLQRLRRLPSCCLHWESKASWPCLSFLLLSIWSSWFIN